MRPADQDLDAMLAPVVHEQLSVHAKLTLGQVQAPGLAVHLRLRVVRQLFAVIRDQPQLVSLLNERMNEWRTNTGSAMHAAVRRWAHGQETWCRHV